MDAALQYMVDKFEHANLVMGEKTNVKSLEAKAQYQKQKGNQSTFAYCSGTHKAVDCNKYKTINARRDRIIAHVCSNCLGVGHSSKLCQSQRTCRIRHLHHHTSVCNQQSSSNSNNSASSSSSSLLNGKGQSSNTRSSS